MQGFTKAILLCGAAAMIGCGSPSFAKNTSKDIRNTMAAKQAAQSALEKKSKELVTEVDGLKDKLVITARVLRETEEQVSVSDKTLKELQAGKAATLKNLYREHDALGGLVAAAGKYNRTPVPQMLLLSEPLDAARAALVMKALIPALREHAEALKVQITEMARIETEISLHRAAEAQQFKKLDSQQSELAGLLRERQDSYRKTESDRASQEKELASLAREAKDLADLERKLQEQAERENRAKSVKKPSALARSAPLPANMVQPVAGTVKIAFGESDDLGGRSEGLTYATRAGATVVTPLAGKVKFAGPFQKYRQILIIEHAGGYHSLIAGLGRIDTVVGARLAAGEPVGAADNSPQDSKIYFELRRGGDPVNPRNAMIAQRKQDKS